MRKSRFGSKTGRDSNRDAEQDVKEDPDGSKSISDEDESPDAEEGIDRYERSSDRYRAAAGERVGASFVWKQLLEEWRGFWREEPKQWV